MHKKYLIYLFSFFFLFVIFALCAKNKEGSIKDGFFISQNPPFSIALPNMNFGSLKTEQVHLHEHATEVFFHNDLGMLFRVFVSNLDGKEAFIQKEKLKEFYLDVFKEAVLPTIQAALPNATVLHEEAVALENKNEGLLVLIDFPKGSLLQDSSTKERFNSMRGCLVTVCESHLLVISYQSDMQFMTFSCMSEEEKKETYKKVLIESANSYKNVSINKRLIPLLL